MSQKIELPAGWRQGYRSFPSVGADDGDVYLFEGKTPHDSYIVRYDYRQDGFRVFRFWPNSKAQRLIERKSGQWFSVPEAPTLPDPLALIMWLKVEGVC